MAASANGISSVRLQQKGDGMLSRWKSREFTLHGDEIWYTVILHSTARAAAVTCHYSQEWSKGGAVIGKISCLDVINVELSGKGKHSQLRLTDSSSGRVYRLRG